MTVCYHTHDGELIPNYVCQRQGIETATRHCQFVQGMFVDELIGKMLVERCVPIPPTAWKIRQTSTEAIERIREMARTEIDSEIADKLNQQQLRSGTGLSFTGRRVYMLRRDYDIVGPYEHLHEKGFTESIEEVQYEV